MTASTQLDDADALLTVDELAAAVGLTVRTTRYYASLGLLPPPLRGQPHGAHLSVANAVRHL